MSRAASIVTAVLLFAVAAPAAAQQSVDRPTTRAEISSELDARFARLDRDKDGFFTKTEFVVVQKEGQQRIAANVAAALSAEFAALDSNKDGFLTSAEMAAKGSASSADLFKTVDTNGDGKISKDEYLVPSQRVVATAKAETQIAKFDSNRDGKVSLEEYKARPLASFDAADANKDGTVSAEEKKKVLAQRGR